MDDNEKRKEKEKIILKTQENSPNKIIANSRNLRFNKKSEEISKMNQRKILSEIFDVLLATVIYTKNSKSFFYDRILDLDLEKPRPGENTIINKNNLFSPNLNSNNFNYDNNINNNNNDYDNNNESNNNNNNNNINLKKNNLPTELNYILTETENQQQNYNTNYSNDDNGNNNNHINNKILVKEKFSFKWGRKTPENDPNNNSEISAVSTPRSSIGYSKSVKNSKKMSDTEIENTICNSNARKEKEEKNFLSPILQRSADSRKVPVPFQCPLEYGKVSLYILFSFSFLFCFLLLISFSS